MTLILSRSTMHYVIQVADRLVSRGGVPLDPQFNKNIILFAKDAVVTIGFTGLAQIERKPTDLWVVEQITGHQFILQPSGAVSMTTMLNYKLESIGLILQHLTEALNKIPGKLTFLARSEWSDSILRFGIYGWMWNKKAFRPLVAHVIKDAGNPDFHVEYMDRYWHLPRTGGGFPAYTEALPIENISFARIVAINNRIQSVYGGTVSDLNTVVDYVEDVLVEEVQEVSISLPHVGGHCICILINTPNVGRIRIRYRPLTIRSESPTSEHQQHGAYTPWVVHPGNILSPSFFNNAAYEGTFGRYTYSLDSKLILGPPSSATGQRTSLI